LEDRALPSTFTVTNIADNGAGSLRQAILSANSSGVSSTIQFAIPGSGLQVIKPSTALPTITVPVVIDGFTQPGSSPNTNGPGLDSNAVLTVDLNGAGAGKNTDGLVLAGGNSTVKGLMVTGFRFVGIDLQAHGGDVIAGDTITGNNEGNLTVESGVDGSTIGGTDPASRTQISGTDTTDGDISVQLNSNNNIVQNVVMDGMSVTGNQNTIGGTSAAARNVIAGPTLNTGLTISGSNNTVQGNFIGTDITGNQVAAENDLETGLSVTGSNNTIGGTVAGADNVISGNEDGLGLGGTGNTVQGNLIGLGASGGLLGNGGAGISISGPGTPQNNLIGGNTAAAANVVAGNFRGVIVGFGANANLIEGNLIGVLQDGLTPAGNTLQGVFVTFTAVNNTIGGTTAGTGNLIANTTVSSIKLAGNGDGVFVQAVAGDLPPTNNSILGNSIFGNARFGIELSPVSQTAPVLSSATSSTRGTSVKGSVHSTANTTLRLEFFVDPTLDSNGKGEGKQLLGALSVTTDGNGAARFTANFTTSVTVGQFVTATATAPGVNTSQFSSAVIVKAASTAPAAAFAFPGNLIGLLQPKARTVLESFSD
jgi:titin